MATRLVGIHDPDENVFDEVRRHINESFDSLIYKLNERREALLEELDLLEEEFYSTRISCMQSLEDIRKERTQLEVLLAEVKINQARTSLENGISSLNKEIKTKKKKLRSPQIIFHSSEGFESQISKLGSLTVAELLVRNYCQISKPVKMFGRFGSGKSKIYTPRGMLVDDAHQRLFIADLDNPCVHVWSLKGNYLTEFGRGTIEDPWEMVLYDNFIFVSHLRGCCLSKWHIDTFNLVCISKTSIGSKFGQLFCPAGIDVDKGEIFVIEVQNNRISVFDINLNFKRTMANNMIDKSHCLKVRNNTIYIVEDTGIIKLFSKADKVLRTIENFYYYPLPKNVRITHFNLDSQLNFFIPIKDSLYILSPEGQFIHSISFHELNIGRPFGVDITRDGRIAVVFGSGTNPIAIF